MGNDDFWSKRSGVQFVQSDNFIDPRDDALERWLGRVLAAAIGFCFAMLLISWWSS